MADLPSSPPEPRLVSTPDRDPLPTVLLVDDEPRILETTAHMLGVEGFRVVTAEDGESAYRMVAAQAPDVILLDVKMPGPDGFEVCRRLKTDPGTVFIPVVLVTALHGAQDRIAGAAAGADDFLSKPFDHLELATRVKSLLRVKRLHDQLQAYTEELERRVAERTAELQRALESLQELDRLKSELIANVSHELRTPLLHVKGFVSLLADGAMGELTQSQAEGLTVAKDAIGQLERVVEDIVDYSSIHERRLALEPVYVADVCRNAIQAVAPVAAQRKVSLSMSVPPQALQVRADRVVLTRVLRHLLDNAVKFGPSDDRVQILVEKRGGIVRLAVRDQGPGIPAEELPHIFEPFYQADGSTTRRVGGLGLGLALVKKMVEALGSQVRLDSEAGKGSTVYFDLLDAGP